jgi:DNA polymerase-3 subunit epsilon
VVTDLIITAEDIESLKRTVQELDLKEEQVRALHAGAFAKVISQFIDDQRPDDRERLKLTRLHRCLSLLGWAPGE